MNRQDLISKIARDAGVTKKAANIALNSVIDGITLALEKGDKVSLVGLGTFSINDDESDTTYPGPRVKVKIKLGKRKKVIFKAGKRLIQAVK